MIVPATCNRAFPSKETISSCHVRCKETTCTYLEPVCPMFLGFNPLKKGPFQSKQWTFGFQVCIPGTQEAPPFHWPKSLPDWMIPDWKGVICGDRNMGCGGNHQFPATSHVPSGKQTGDVKPSRKPTYAILGSFYQNHRLKHTLECDILIPRRIIPNTIISAKNSTRNDVPRCSRWHRFSMCVCVRATKPTRINSKQLFKQFHPYLVLISTE